MKTTQDVIGLRLDIGKDELKKQGFKIGKITFTLAPKDEPNGYYRIVKQQLGQNNTIDLVVVKELSRIKIN